MSRWLVQPMIDERRRCINSACGWINVYWITLIQSVISIIWLNARQLGTEWSGVIDSVTFVANTCRRNAYAPVNWCRVQDHCKMRTLLPPETGPTSSPSQLNGWMNDSIGKSVLNPQCSLPTDGGRSLSLWCIAAHTLCANWKFYFNLEIHLNYKLWLHICRVHVTQSHAGEIHSEDMAAEAMTQAELSRYV